MRSLVACGRCRRQYDAAGVEPGSKFHCVCGAAVEAMVPQRGHDAAVVRCSACGAARGGTSTKCGHCGSDFTLHERDLHTVCPKCAARVSDKARFCHHCGQSLASIPVESIATQLACPFCEDAPALFHRSVGDPALPVLECQRCLGLWLQHPAVEELIRRAEGVLDVRRLLPRRTTEPVAVATSVSKWQYRECPHCHGVMNRRNLGRGSGVVVDTCGTHGVWFDDDELHALLDWVHRGGQAMSPKPDLRRASDATGRPRPDATAHPDESEAEGRGLGGIDLEDVLAFALRLIFD